MAEQPGAKALRNIDRLGGKSYKAGEAIPQSVIDGMTPQLVRVLVNNNELEIAGMTPDAAAGNAHHKARLDQLHEKVTAQAKTIETLQASHDDLAKRLAALEGGKPAKPAKTKAADKAGNKE